MPFALDFTWTAPDTCPTRAEVVEQLNRAVDSGEKELPPLVARAIVRQDGSSWRLELTTEMDGRKGTRQLEADTCEGLARAATLVLALTLGEGLARRQAEVEARAAEPPPPAKPPAHVVRPAPPAGAPQRPHPHRAAWAALGASSDALGTWGPAFAVGARYEPQLFAIGASVRASLPRSSELAGAVGTVRSFSIGAELALCLAGTLRPFQLSACASAGLMLLDAQGHGTARDAHALVPLYAAGPSVSLRWLVGKHGFVGLGLDSRFFLLRPELVVEGWERQRRVESVSFGAELAGGVRW